MIDNWVNNKAILHLQRVAIDNHVIAGIAIAHPYPVGQDRQTGFIYLAKNGFNHKIILLGSGGRDRINYSHMQTSHNKGGDNYRHQGLPDILSHHAGDQKFMASAP